MRPKDAVMRTWCGSGAENGEGGIQYLKSDFLAGIKSKGTFIDCARACRGANHSKNMRVGQKRCKKTGAQGPGFVATDILPQTSAAS
jgi:hypothetical protein